MPILTLEPLTVEPVARLISISDIADLLRPTSPTGTVSRERADQISRRTGFPAPAQVGRTGRLWDEDDVTAWIAENRRPLDPSGETPE